jgi:tetratricopeptide (TPR) repeat protein
MSESLSPEQIVTQAKAVYQQADFAAAAEAFGRAAAAYAAQGDALMAAEMKNNQSVALLRVRAPSAALEAVQGTDEVFAKVEDFRRQGMALANLAAVLEALKRKDETLDAYRRSAEALEKAGEWDLRAEVMQFLAAHYLRRGKFYDAVLTMQSGLAGVKNPTPRQKFFKKFLFMRIWR